MRLLYPSNLLTKNFSTMGYLNRLGNDNRFSTVTGDPNHLYKNQLFQDINKKPPLIYQKMQKIFFWRTSKLFGHCRNWEMQQLYAKQLLFLRGFFLPQTCQAFFLSCQFIIFSCLMA